jgi:hypothetical protein
MDLRWGGGDINRIREVANELVGLHPDIIVTNGGPATVAVQRETRTIPIVFAIGVDPVASGIVARLDRPGGNVTGFATFEASLGGKWLELLLEIAPGLKRPAIMFNPDLPGPPVYMPSLETAARSLKIELIIAPVHSDVRSGHHRPWARAARRPCRWEPKETCLSFGSERLRLLPIPRRHSGMGTAAISNGCSGQWSLSQLPILR